MRRVVLASALAIVLPIALTSMQPAGDLVDVSVLGPQVGETIPSFNLLDQSGSVRTRESIMGPVGAMIVFHRSANW